MIFILKDKRYGVRFYRSGTTTTAEFMTEQDGQLDITNVKGEALCSPKDRFEKSKGRKIALAKLLDRLQEMSAGDSKPEIHLTKEDRGSIWNTYFKTHRV